MAQVPDRSPPPALPGSPFERRLLGGGALLALVALFVFPVVRHRDATVPAPVTTAAPLDEQAKARNAAASGQVEQLQVASDELQKAAAQVFAARTSTAAASVTAAPVDSTTACIQSFVPEATFGPGQLDWVCRQPDVWSIELDLHARARKRGSGTGAELWTRLGRFELAAIAVFRTACCSGAVPLLAKVPATKCGSLADALTALGQDPSPEQTQRYDQTMSCLAERKVWFPENWTTIDDKQAKQAFEEFLAFVRKR